MNQNTHFKSILYDDWLKTIAKEKLYFFNFLFKTFTSMRESTLKIHWLHDFVYLLSHNIAQQKYQAIENFSFYISATISNSWMCNKCTVKNQTV